ncbi:hypothetical protein COT29_01210 [Candidatus Micrarchaeota archaeon CG08_land_8_20_14_0_20_59_11]|nr:MAG: hypothetical protein COT29_01210 [Candidatus Micrarchaeota archaeon CG08_land_8_20_14_0_20_59_11]
MLAVRIAMLGWEFPPFMSGGLGVHCEKLSHALAEQGLEIDFYLPKNGCRIPSNGVNIVPVYYSQQHERMDERNADPYYRLKNEMSLVSRPKELLTKPSGSLKKIDRYNIRVAREIRQRNARKRYDLIHVHGRFNVAGALLAKHFTGVPVVWTVHSTAFDEAAEFEPDPLQLATEKLGARHSDRVIAVSRLTRSKIIGGLNAPPRKVSVVYNGINSADFSATRRKHKNKKVLFHGRLTGQKGPKYFLLAAKKVMEKTDGVEFVMSGKGNLGDNLKAFAKSLRIKSNVSFPGFVSKRALPSLYASSDVFVLPSVSEPFGITVLEAMAAGTPVVISKTCGVGEVIRNCLKADYWDADAIAENVCRVLDNERLAQKMSEKGRREIGRLSWDRVSSDTIKVYGKVA